MTFTKALLIIVIATIISTLIPMLSGFFYGLTGWVVNPMVFAAGFLLFGIYLVIDFKRIK